LTIGEGEGREMKRVVVLGPLGSL